MEGKDKALCDCVCCSKPKANDGKLCHEVCPQTSGEKPRQDIPCIGVSDCLNHPSPKVVEQCLNDEQMCEGCSIHPREEAPKESWRERFRDNHFQNKIGTDWDAIEAFIDAELCISARANDEYWRNRNDSLCEERHQKARQSFADELCEKVEGMGDIWKLEETAEQTCSGCPKFVRINRDITNVIRKSV